ncbi:unnamed protein product [Zymoseptoria tritici ST99CH_3D7]|uniref:Uncharacterized protein n=1 Tax=Zymoseptoria tritici (strain ST99CH_3D7) TaxID=1276538 RepID=A0A1X7RWT5_ZYMT9|nr:unnamed protein product [Zymoseptoria tritici ST99CH_3D7]
MHAPPTSTPQSTWTSFSDLSKYGWINEESHQDINFKARQEIKLIMSDPLLAPTHLSANNIKIRLMHGVNRSVDNKVYLETGGYFEQLYNVEGGTMFATSLWSPRYTGAQMPIAVTGEKYAFPPICFWSDVVYLQWEELAKNDMQLKGLQRVVHCSISNDTTRAIIDKILSDRGTIAGELVYPGVTISFSDGDDFKALLGTPNACGTAYLLAQHKGQLGQKVVKRFDVFSVFSEGQDMKAKVEGKWAYAMVIHVGD